VVAVRIGLWRDKTKLPSREEALPGRATPLPAPEPHLVLGTSPLPPYPPGCMVALFGMGCFWGAERLFWQLPGVYTTAVGYGGGYTPNPTYEEVCTGLTGHAELVLVVYNTDPTQGQTTTFGELLKAFWEGHDPTQGMRQGNDVGSQYRSMIVATNEVQFREAEASKASYEASLQRAGYGPITTEILLRPAPPGALPAATFYFAERYHQQYLARNPFGYCGLGGCGVPFPAVQ
jgi:peptide-methionine (S)-S-oxide reductase